MMLSYYKTVLMNLGSYFKNEPVLTWASISMQLYVFLFHIWGMLEVFSFLNFWWKFGCAHYFSREEMIEQLIDYAFRFD